MTSTKLLQDALAVKQTMDELIKLSDKLFVCMECGAVNSYFKYSCELCERKAEWQQEMRHYDQ